MIIDKYSFGTGDRFGLQGKAQLKAVMKAGELGIDLVPVWNKSFREHSIIHSQPSSVRTEADLAVKELGWKGNYYVDADHINLKNVDHFIGASDFFTIDVAEAIGKPPGRDDIDGFLKRNTPYTGRFTVPGIFEPFEVTGEMLHSIAARFLHAAREASVIYNHIQSKKGAGNFVAEVSMDEVPEPQSPIELFFILSALAAFGVPVQTIAPKFTGRFNKGVDYEGDVKQFEKEFENDLLVIDFAVREFGLPENLKLSVHSGSDKFAIYPLMGRLIRKHNKGIHVKTAGTTWLEEVIGLAMAGGEGLEAAKSIYKRSLEKMDALCAPYASVISIDRQRLPSAAEVEAWDGQTFAATLRHVQEEPRYNPHFRQLIHVGYKMAVDMGSRFTDLLVEHREIVGQQVTENLFDRHIRRLFDS